jgi:phosphohistidine phosphatase SixA
LAALLTPLNLAAQNDPVVVFLVRHAERADDEPSAEMISTDDPMLSGAGEERARLVAELLRDAGITHIHTTDYNRTRATGAPTAAALGLEMAVYDPRDLPGFAERLRRTPGRHLVLGHSNTTPDLVAALGGDPQGPIAEMEYDRLYLVTLTDEGATAVLLRFGARYQG